MVGETLSAGIGQGYFLTTAAQLSLALAQLINNGNKLNPKLIYDNETVNIYNERIIADPKYLKIIKNALDEATNAPGGTSYRSRIIGKYQMAGKTGTSQVRAISIKEWEKSSGTFLSSSNHVSVIFNSLKFNNSLTDLFKSFKLFINGLLRLSIFSSFVDKPRAFLILVKNPSVIKFDGFIYDFLFDTILSYLDVSIHI